MSAVLKIENVWKQYRLGVINHGLLYKDVQSYIARKMGRPDPHLPEDTQIGGQGERFWALKGIDLEIEQGDRVGIIGRNGAGKSTLLKILSRVTAPTKGQIKVKGRIASLLEVGTGFHPELTGRENVYLNGAIMGMSKFEIKRKMEEIVDFAGVEKFIDTPVKRYSSGMHVRLGFSVAAHLEPEILVVDEVLAVGDAEFQKKALGKMEDVSKGEGRTVLFVSHNMASVALLCKTACYLKDGTVSYYGEVSKALELYKEEGMKVDTEYNFSVIEKNRYGNGKARFTQLNVKPRFDEIVTGKAIHFNLHFDVYKQINSAIVALIIYSSDGLRLIDINTAIKGDLHSFSEGNSYEINFSIEKLLLRPGHYFVGLWIGKPNEDIDGIQYTKRINVQINTAEQKYEHVYPGYYQAEFNYNLIKL